MINFFEVLASLALLEVWIIVYWFSILRGNFFTHFMYGCKMYPGINMSLGSVRGIKCPRAIKWWSPWRSSLLGLYAPLPSYATTESYTRRVNVRTQLGRILPNSPTPKGWKARVGPRRVPKNRVVTRIRTGNPEVMSPASHHSAIEDRIVPLDCGRINYPGYIVSREKVSRL
jgi:hypothetical protein